MLDRRFAALRWERRCSATRPCPEQLAALRLHALIVNPGADRARLHRVDRRRAARAGAARLRAPAPVADRVRGLRAGADDWITKPCHPEELVARLEAVLRRRRAGELPVADETIVAGELAIRPDRFDAYAGGQPPRSRARSTSCCIQLASADGRVLEREDIYQRVWGYTMARGDRSVDVFVRKLRQKLERVSPDWRYVHTHFGVGYRFAAEPADGVGAGPRAGRGAGAGPRSRRRSPSPSPSRRARRSAAEARRTLRHR